MTNKELKRKREEIVEEMTLETETAKRYTKLAFEKLAKGERGIAIKFYDIVCIAWECAMQKHDELWDLVGEDMTEEEFKHFCEAETCYTDRIKLAKALRGEKQ